MDNELGIRYGFIAGFLAMFFLTTVYVSNPQLLLGYTRLGVWGIITVVMFLGCYRIRKDNSDGLGFREALRAAFLIYVIGNAFVSVFTHYIFAFHDPTLAEFSRQVDVDYLNQMKEGMPSYEYEEKMNQIKSISYAPTFRDSFFGFAVLSIYGFGVSLIVALFMQREK